MSLLEARKTYKPFEYPWAYDFWKRQQQVHWMPEEVPLGEDCRDWAQKLSEHERNLLTQIFRFFTQADVEVQDCYHEKYGRVFKPTEIKMMLASFSNMETIHIAAYSHLLDTIGMPESEYGMFLEYEEMKDKHDYLQQFGVDTDEDIARTLAAFGGFTEGMQLFASFAMLTNVPFAASCRMQCDQAASTALRSMSRTSPATSWSCWLSMACMDATGSMALTSVPPSTSRRITLQGSIAPTRGSIPMALCAMPGLQAPRMR